MHPIVIITFEETAEVTQAKEMLEAAGESVKILLTGESLLIDFLGALAGDSDVEEISEEDEEAEVEDAPLDNTGGDLTKTLDSEKLRAKTNPPAEEPPAKEVKEAYLNGELVNVVLLNEDNVVRVFPKAVNKEEMSFILTEENEYFYDNQNSAYLNLSRKKGEMNFVAAKIGRATSNPRIEISKNIYKNLK